jgi:hypothetical protein
MNIAEFTIRRKLVNKKVAYEVYDTVDKEMRATFGSKKEAKEFIADVCSILESAV